MYPRRGAKQFQAHRSVAPFGPGLDPFSCKWGPAPSEVGSLVVEPQHDRRRRVLDLEPSLAGAGPIAGIPLPADHAFEAELAEKRMIIAAQKTAFVSGVR